LIRDESPFETRRAGAKRSATPKLVLVAGIVLCIIAVSLLGMGVVGRIESGGTRELLEQKTKELQIKEDQIKAVEAELSKVRLEAADITKEAVALKARLEEGQKELAASQQRLTAVTRDLERLSSRRAEPPSAPRPVERATAPSRPSPRAAESGVYETLRATEVHEQPTQGSRVISRIGGGTRINVVRSDGEWLEVVSRRGNPPGFILRDHARFVGSAN
jgi:hypothetical protein